MSEPELLVGDAELGPGDDADVLVRDRAELVRRPVPLGLLRLVRDRLLAEGRVPVWLMLEPSELLDRALPG